MKFPLPEVKDHRFTLCRYPLPDAPVGLRKHHHFYDNGICAGCGKTHVRTCRVEKLPNLCKPCYDWVYKYSHMDDPYRVQRLPKDKDIEPALVKKMIRYAKIGKLQSGLTLTAVALAVLKRLRK